MLHGVLHPPSSPSVIFFFLDRTSFGARTVFLRLASFQRAASKAKPNVANNQSPSRHKKHIYLIKSSY